MLEHKLNLLFDFVHIVTGKFSEHMKKYFFKDFIAEVLDLIEYFANSKNLKLIRKYRSSCEIISFDFERFMAMIIHIALNSIKYTTNGIIKIRMQYKNGELAAKITDSGIGIKNSILEHIKSYCNNAPLNINSIMKNALNELENNKLLSGIGLLSSSLIAKKLGGGITINSIENKGTTFKIKIRCQKEIVSTQEVFDESCSYELGIETNDLNNINYNKLNSLKTTSKLEVGSPISKSIKIIVVDDQKFNRITLIGMLKLLNKENISEAENGREAITKTKEVINNFDQIFIFMDVDMPIMNGIDATRIIKKEDIKNQVKIVMLSAFNTEEVIKESLDAGAYDFFVKPISFKKLKELKEKHLL